MQIKRIPKEDFFGIFYVRKPEVALWNAYYNTIGALRPLLAEKEFSKVVNGFYINYNYKEQLTRISYFVNEANLQEAVSMFQNFFKKNAISEVKSESPREEIVAKKYGGKECARYRNFPNIHITCLTIIWSYVFARARKAIILPKCEKCGKVVAEPMLISIQQKT